jgi:hypothetical protein
MEASKNFGSPMRYNPRRTHRPSRKGLDRKTGKVQKMTNDEQCEKPKKTKETFSQATTPEQAEKVKQYFIERISNSKRWKALFRDRLLPNEDYFDSEVWEKIMKEHPESATPFLTFVAFADVYETLGLKESCKFDKP